MSRRLAAHPFSQQPTSALPPPPALGPRRPSSARSLELRENEAAAAAAATAAAAAASFSGVCDSFTGAIDGRRRSFHGGIHVRQDRGAGIASSEREGARSARREGTAFRTSPRRAASELGPCLPPPHPPSSRRPAARGWACATLARLFRGVCRLGLAHGGNRRFGSRRRRGFVVLEIGVKEAPKRNFKRNPAFLELRAMRLGPPGAAAACRASPFAAVRNLF